MSFTPPRIPRHVLSLAGIALVWFTLTSAQAQDPGCNLAPSGGVGPYDYRTFKGVAGIERRHFTPKVELLISGESASKPGPDISYMLNVVPNHHRALLSLHRLSQRLNTDRVPDMAYSVDCFFQRAMQFRPDDNVARLIYAQHLNATKRRDLARQQLRLAATHVGENPLSHYNIGLVAVEVEDFELALKHAHMAYRDGLTQPALRDALVRAGQWVEPAVAAEAAASAASR